MYGFYEILPIQYICALSRSEAIQSTQTLFQPCDVYKAKTDTKQHRSIVTEAQPIDSHCYWLSDKTTAAAKRHQQLNYECCYYTAHETSTND